MQFQADVLGVPVARPDLIETTALGAAGLAGLGAGVWKSGEEFLAGRRFSRFEPTARVSEMKARAAEWQRAVDTVLYWARGRVV
jgi:glycerol kinase